MTARRDSRPDWTQPPADHQTDRGLGKLSAVGGVIMLLGSLPGIATQLVNFPWWWNAAAACIAACMCVLVFASTRWPIRLLRACWGGIPAVSTTLLLVSFPAARPAHAPDVFPWVWFLEPATVTLLALLLRPGAAILLALVSALTPAFSALVTLGTVPHNIGAATPIHLGNVVLVVLFIGIRARLGRLREAERKQLDAESRRARASAERDRHAALSLLVHDEVLSVLGAATLFTGDPPEVLRQEARHAIAVLQGAPGTPGSPNMPAPSAVDNLTTEAAAERLLAALSPIVHGVRFTVNTEPGDLPTHAVEQVGLAAAEALRNSRRHAGVGTQRAVCVKLSGGAIAVRITDDGVGFDPTAVPPERLGIQQSIISRMREIGGASTLQASPGAGVSVELKWVAP